MSQHPPRRLTITVDESLSGRTVDAILRGRLHLSGTVIKCAKRTPGGILLDQTPVFVTHRAEEGQRLSVLIGDSEAGGNVKPVRGCLSIVYEDEDILILDKPPGLAVHPGPGDQLHTLANAVVFHYEATEQRCRFRAVNRLDRGTSGLLCVAKHAYVQERLTQQLHTAAFRREYLAVCEGSPDPADGVIDAPIGRDPTSAIRRMVQRDGKPARTEYRTMASRGAYTLLSLTLVTGRTHQIRVHLAYRGYPLAGDFLYGTEDNAVIARPALHCAALSLIHPITGQALAWRSPLPDDMRALINSAPPRA